MTDNAPTIEGLQALLVDLEARVGRLENLDAPVPPFVKVGLALESVLTGFHREVRRRQRRERDD
jgi:hypothetical protein